MKKVKLFEQFISEAKMPDKLIGNDEIVFLKTKEDSRGAHYNLYYKGHEIEKGGARFGSEKELKAFADDYILSNQLYNKLKYEDSKPLPESVVTEKISIGKVLAIKKYNAKTNREEVVDVRVTDYIKKPGSKDFVEYDFKGKKRKVSINVFKSMIAEDIVNATPESIVNESDISEEGYKLNGLADNQVGGVPATEFQEEHNLDLDALTRAVHHTGEITKYEIRDIIQGKVSKTATRLFLKKYKK